MGKGSSKGAFNRPFGALASLGAGAPQPVDKKPALFDRASNARWGEARRALPDEGGRERPPLTDEELFHSEVSGAVPLTARADRIGAPPTPPDRPRRSSRSDEAEVLAELADLCTGSGSFDLSDGDEYLEGIAAGVDRGLLKRLRAGDFAVQAHVDLHGLTRDEARSRVARFVEESRRAHRRCVLIVHGRGLHSKEQVPVLKQAVRVWLERGSIARSVLAFATARPSDGGAGAMYVLLRR